MSAPRRDPYARAIRGVLRAYKATLSPLLGPACRFAPSCSEYAAEALIAHGPVRGGALAVRRFCRCRPGGSSGYDPVPPSPLPGRRPFKCDA